MIDTICKFIAYHLPMRVLCWAYKRVHSEGALHYEVGLSFLTPVKRFKKEYNL